MENSFFPGYGRCIACQELVLEKEFHDHTLNCRAKSSNEKKTCSLCNQLVSVKQLKQHMETCNQDTNSQEHTSENDDVVLSLWQTQYAFSNSLGTIMISRDGTGIGDRPLDLSFFLYFFHMKIFKFLVDLNRILHRMPNDQLVEAEYTDCDHIEKKFDANINYRPAGYRSTGQTGSISEDKCSLNINFYNDIL
jgi:hypothetical protein